MLVILVERAPVGLRGELTRWLIEPRAGVFVGRVSAMVREKLWQRVCAGVREGAAMIIWTTNNEQGFDIAFWGATGRWVTDWDGLKLITRPRKTDSAPAGAGRSARKALAPSTAPDVAHPPEDPDDPFLKDRCF